MALVGKGGREVRFHHNQAVFPAGLRDEGVNRYIGISRRMRPDVTVTIRRPGQPERGFVIEVKNSSVDGTLVAGFAEAIVYRNEYAPWLLEWPKAVLVAAGGVTGRVREGDEVCASAWKGWAPAPLLEALRRAVA